MDETERFDGNFLRSLLIFTWRKSILQNIQWDVGYRILACPSTACVCGTSLLSLEGSQHGPCIYQKSLLAPQQRQNISLPMLLVSAHCQ